MILTPLKITSWIMGKGIKLIKSLKVDQVPLSHHLGLNKSRYENIKLVEGLMFLVEGLI